MHGYVDGPVAARQRMAAAGATGMVLALVGLVLIYGLRVPVAQRIGDTLTMLDIRTPPPPPRREPPPPERAMERPKPKPPSPANLRNVATPVVAPPPVVRLPPPTPVIAAPRPDIGAAAQSGASDRRGPGSGAGGGSDGSGGGGDGEGGGTPPRQIAGRLRYGDLPADLREDFNNREVGVRYRVQADGRVTDCVAERSSGIAELDRTACALIEQRFRFRPARDENGRPVRSTVVETHGWYIDRTEDR